MFLLGSIFLIGMILGGITSILFLTAIWEDNHRDF
jgi:hypothetical protein